MSGPILFFVAVVVIDLILKSAREKKKVQQDRNRKTTPTTKPQVEKKRSGGTLRDLKRMMEEEFEKQAGSFDNVDPRRVESGKDRSQSTGYGSPLEKERPVKKTREELIQNQKDKINKHSEFEKSRRLQKEQMLTKARLSDSQVTLASQHVNGSKNAIGDYDFGTKKSVTIELKDSEKARIRSRSQGILNIKEDILKGIIYSEILSKPKSMKK